MARGFDVFRLTPSEHLTQNEIDAANLVRFDEFNPQHQPEMSWPATAPVASAYVDQLMRGGALNVFQADRMLVYIDRARRAPAGAQRRAATQTAANHAREMTRGASGAEATRAQALLDTLGRMGGGR
jgi:hypothetical protein